MIPILIPKQRPPTPARRRLLRLCALVRAHLSSMLRQVLCRRAPAFFKPVLKRFEIIADFSGEVSIRTFDAGLLVAAAAPSCLSSCLVLLLAGEAVESN